MNKKEELEQALKLAMKAGDDTRKRTIRMALSNIKLQEIEKRASLDDAAIISVLQKEIKMRNESIEGAKKLNRTDLIDANLDEIRVLESFLPAQLSEDDVRKIAEAVIKELNATTPTEMGKVMKELLPRLQGQATNSLASQVVKQLLSN
ncbi:MAG: GatB/YqeY domain-containing protein [Chloroflexi bacterium]|nr:GatB/YqeY domain-containing protein [Chloroflexota bacterium]